MSEPLDLDAIEARAKAATPGPWTHEKSGGMVYAYEMKMRVFDIRGWGYLTGVGGLHMKEEAAIKVQEANGDFVVNAREDVPAMARELRKLREENARLKAAQLETLDHYAKLREEARWIPVGERLPEERATVDVVTRFGIVAGTLRTNRFWPLGKEINPTRWRTIYAPTVTHWRPLPAPPEAKP